MVKHHLPDEVLMAYSAGNLPEAFNVVVASHVSLSDDSRVRLDTYDAVGGAVLETIDSVEMSEGSLEATLARISQAPQDAVASEPCTAKPGIFPSPLQAYVGGDLDAVKWRSVGMGVKQCILKTSKDATVRLLYIPSGVAMPDHGHTGMEMTLVLKGAFQDEIDHFARGDVEIADQDLHHTPVAVGAEDCICLSATDARLKFNALLPRLAQPFLQI